jgi:hypothetical protein
MVKLIYLNLSRESRGRGRISPIKQYASGKEQTASLTVKWLEVVEARCRGHYDRLRWQLRIVLEFLKCAVSLMKW